MNNELTIRPNYRLSWIMVIGMICMFIVTMFVNNVGFWDVTYVFAGMTIMTFLMSWHHHIKLEHEQKLV